MTQRSTSRTAFTTVAILALAACGSDDGTTTGSSDLPPPSSVADSDLRSPTPIQVVRGGASGADLATSAATAPAVGGEIVTSDLMIAPSNAEYLLGESLPALPTDDTGYVFVGEVGGSAVTAEQVGRIATVLGVEGEPIAIDEGAGVTWRVGVDDGSGPSIWVATDGPLGWNYNAPWAEGFESCAVSIDADGNESSDCPEPRPPSGVPSVADAEQRARELLTALGVDVANLSFESFGDEWFTSVDVSDDTDPRAPVRSWSFGFGGDGVLQYAGGSLATPEPVGPYPLVDLNAAAARLSDGFFGGFGAGIAIVEPALPTVGEAEAVLVEPDVGPDVVTDAAGEEPTQPGEPAPGEPMPVEPMPVEPVPGEPVVITLVDVQPDLWWAWDADGSAWLLPAFRFIDTDGGWHVVPAVADEFLIQTDPVVIDEPLPAPEPLPEPSPEPGIDPETAITVLEEYVGLSIEEFAAEAQAVGFTTRIVVEDGEALAVTADYSETRVNVAIEGPRVVEIESIG